MSPYNINQPVIIDAHDGPLRGEFVGYAKSRFVHAPNSTYLRVRVTETAQGYTEGETIDALPQRVSPAPVADADPDHWEITDAELDGWRTGLAVGRSNAEPYLRPLAPRARAIVVDEAYTRMNVSPGFNFSGAVWQAVKDYPATPCLDFAQQERASRVR